MVNQDKPMLTMEQFVDELVGEEYRNHYINIGREIARKQAREQFFREMAPRILSVIVSDQLPISDEKVAEITELSVEEIRTMRCMIEAGNEA